MTILTLHLSISILVSCHFESSPIATFSIIGSDPDTGELGVAVQSKIVAVGAVVPWARAGIGAIATQSFANVSYGQKGLELLKKGKSPKDVIVLLTENDAAKAYRQVGVLASNGNAANFTGEKCMKWAGGISGKSFTIQGNILANENVISEMAKSFIQSNGKAPLAQRLINALKAGQLAGGEKRGRQSASLLVVKENWGYGGNNDRFRDLRVDDHQTPIEELQRVYDKHIKLFPRPKKYELKK
ncbi:MAG: DUF1028 domain-containing protein [Verrucomicrobiales bacterium]|nr:DUF1028 domain-containing protein [Verrucomicrobiales bacterium]